MIHSGAWASATGIVLLNLLPTAEARENGTLESLSTKQPLVVYRVTKDATLPLGRDDQTNNLAEGVAIEFTAVEQDTRCPTNVQCVDQGNAQILLTTFSPRGQWSVRLNTNQAPINAVFEYYGVELRSLDPKPTLDARTGSSTIPLSSYEARVFVIKAFPSPPPGPT